MGGSPPAAGRATRISINGVSHHLRNPCSLPNSLAKLASPSGQGSPILLQAMTGQVLPADSTDRPFPLTNLHLLQVGPAAASTQAWEASSRVTPWTPRQFFFNRAAARLESEALA